MNIKCEAFYNVTIYWSPQLKLTCDQNNETFITWKISMLYQNITCETGLHAFFYL